MSLFQTGDFSLRSGTRSRWKICCESLSGEDWECLALMASEILPPFGVVESVPSGGDRFAESLRRYSTDGPLLIAEDVVTTGTSMEKIRSGREALGVCVFSRGEVPEWVTAIFRMS